MDTKALRQKILDLAIRGKLVPQDPSDEPASVLLEKIREEKARMVKEGKLKKKDIKNDSIIYVGDDNLHYEKFQDGTVRCIEDEIPFEVPEGWAWERLSNLAAFSGGKTPSTSHQEYWGGEVPWVTSKDMKSKYITSSQLRLSILGAEQMKMYQPDTLLLVTRSGILRHTLPVSILKEPATINQDLKAIALYMPQLAEYIYICLKGMEAQLLLKYTKSGTTVENINFDEFQKVLFPIAPLQEIARIIAATCEAEQIVSSIEDDKTALAEYVVKAKTKILDLAIRGQLVPQNPDDEPASVLLERIRAEKEELIKQGKIKRDKKESVIFKGEDNSYYAMINGAPMRISEYLGFELPDGWAWITLKEIAVITSGKTPKPNQLSANGSIPYFKVADMNTPGNELYLQYADYYINDQYSGSVFDGGSFVFPKNGGAVLTNKKRILANISVVDLNTGVFTPSNLLNKDFIFFLFSSIDFSKIYKGAVIPTVDASLIGNLIYGLPPNKKKKRIADIIKTFFTQLEQIEVALS